MAVLAPPHGGWAGGAVMQVAPEVPVGVHVVGADAHEDAAERGMVVVPAGEEEVGEEVAIADGEAPDDEAAFSVVVGIAAVGVDLASQVGQFLFVGSHRRKVETVKK